LTKIRKPNKNNALCLQLRLFPVLPAALLPSFPISLKLCTVSGFRNLVNSEITSPDGATGAHRHGAHGHDEERRIRPLTHRFGAATGRTVDNSVNTLVGTGV